METISEQIAYFGRMMFERNLTDIAGGNLSVRVDDMIYCSPRYAGHKWHWNFPAEMVVSGSLQTDDLLSNPSFSREGVSHLAVYRALPQVKAIVHAHSPHILVFCAAMRPIEPVLESTTKYGVIEMIDPAPPYSQQQADGIIAELRGKEALIMSAAAAVLIPKHGIFVASQNLWAAMDALERINTNAYCILAQKLLP
ncbi:MAG TPA: class II aldolase/adducin family protein [Anaerolineales bacterium]|nr:class II aldolase/adducin family protein [Anaerolineales bacterium]